MSDGVSLVYPGGSKSRVNRAGANIRDNNASDDDIAVFEQWRSAHKNVLNTFQAYFRITTKRRRHINITIAQRHKRKSTIINKLSRYPSMQLSRMDDIAGCRLIFDDMEALHDFRAKTHKARFRHKLRNFADKYDYIESPKSSGYRGIHNVYEYNANSQSTKDYNGLYIEIQYRTKIQHAWATAVEVVGHITESQPKFQTGDERYHKAMALASEVLARAFEGMNGPYPHLTDNEIVDEFRRLDKSLNLIRTLKGLNLANELVKQHKNVILIFSTNNQLEMRTYYNTTQAITALFELERTYPEKDIVLVSGERSEDIRFAFKNYFSDAQEFVQFVSSGLKKLSERVRKKNSWQELFSGTTLP